MDINIRLAKRTAEIIQDKDQAFNYLNLNAAINQAAREFSERGKKVENFKRTFRGIIC